MGEQIGQVVTASLSEILSLMKENRKQPMIVTSSPFHPDEFLTASEVSKILKISKGLACRLIQTKEMPSFSIGKTVRVRYEDLNAFIQAHMVR